MNTWIRDLLRGAALALGLAFTLALVAQEAPPPTPPASAPAPVAPPPAETAAPAAAPDAKQVATPSEPPPAPAAPSAPAAAPAPAPATTTTAAPPETKSELRRLDNVAPAAEVEQPAAKKPDRRHVRWDTDEMPLGDHTVPADATQREIVSILGSSTVEGEVEHDAVSVAGNTTVNGRAGHDAVAVFGNLEVNGHVGHDAIAVFGNLKLGPQAIIEGQAVAVFGQIERQPGAEVRRGVQHVMSFGNIPFLGSIATWVQKCLLYGRLLAFSPGLGWAWGIAAIHLLLYVLLALIFRRGMEKSAETLEQHPGMSILAALLAMMLSPLVFVLLAITGVGVILIPFLGAALLFAGWFGRAAIHAWFGRLITRHFGASPFAHVAVAVLIGGVIISLLYCVPVLGMLMHFLIGTLGLGVVIYALILSMKKEKAALPPPAAAPAAGAGAGFVAAEPPVVSGGLPQHGSPSPTAVLGSLPVHSTVVQPPPAAAVSLPRAGFWLRLGAFIIDLALCILVLAVLPWIHFRLGLLMLVMAIYGAIMWKLRGTTVGGVVCSLKIVRFDDRPIDWTVAIVRALGCFLSFAVAGLGFIWIALDDQSQSWHDKIAGTVVVRVPKGTPLV